MSTANVLPTNLTVVGTDGNAGLWNGTTMENMGNLGDWTLKMLAFDSAGKKWCVGTGGNVGEWNETGWTDKGELGGWTPQDVGV